MRRGQKSRPRERSPERSPKKKKEREKRKRKVRKSSNVREARKDGDHISPEIAAV
jgi:hypothetical protein